ncbi:NAD(P)-dependent alcohol dehydrogenase [Agromyces sp. MMS24-JH15]|uniref:NAD(P)-dependent alcohol dehydrogenase n=1 Tax=Agromyces sp. MMS24-JH15 TaxID=3243765 RepID=UPI00374A8D75
MDGTMDRGVRTAMRAVVQHRYGGPDVLGIEVVGVPQPKPGELLVAVHAADVASGDVRVMRGEPKLMRLFFGLRRPRVPTVGRDIAGTVAAVGPGVTRFAVGDRVCGESAQGGWAEFAVLSEEFAVRVPEGMGFADASTLPVSAGTALQGLRLAGIAPGHPGDERDERDERDQRDAGDERDAGDRPDATATATGARGGGRPHVLVIGASGGVGSYAVQLAVEAGCEVTGVCSASKSAHVRAQGAARVLDRAGDWAAGEPDGAYDAVFDLAGAQSLGELARLVRRGGTVVLSAGGGDGLLGPIPRLIGALVRSPFSHARLAPLAAVRNADDLAALVGLLADGRLHAPVERVVPLADAAAAVRDHLAGRVAGKLVLAVA